MLMDKNLGLNYSTYESSLVDKIDTFTMIGTGTSGINGH